MIHSLNKQNARWCEGCNNLKHISHFTLEEDGWCNECVETEEERERQKQIDRIEAIRDAEREGDL